MSPPPDSAPLAALRSADATRPARILVVDADPALATLIEEWLQEAGCEVVVADATEAADAGGPFDLVLVDVPFPRRAAAAPLGRMTNAHPPPPVIALSSTFFAGVDGNAAVARALGVTGVLAKPVDRIALVALIRRLLS